MPKIRAEKPTKSYHQSGLVDKSLMAKKSADENPDAAGRSRRSKNKKAEFGDPLAEVANAIWPLRKVSATHSIIWAEARGIPRRSCRNLTYAGAALERRNTAKP